MAEIKQLSAQLSGQGGKQPDPVIQLKQQELAQDAQKRSNRMRKWIKQSYN